jgi:hypothetical protein
MELMMKRDEVRVEPEKEQRISVIEDRVEGEFER